MKTAISASRSSHTGTGFSLWLVWSGTSISLFACKIPGKLIQAAEFRPLASSNPKGTQMAGTGGQPSILPTEPCLCSKEPGREQITSRSLQKPLPLSPRASSELCPCPGEESHPACRAISTQGDTGMDLHSIPTQCCSFPTFSTNSLRLSPGLHCSWPEPQNKLNEAGRPCVCDHSIMSSLLPFHSESHYRFKEVRHLIESTPNLLEVT